MFNATFQAEEWFSLSFFEHAAIWNVLPFDMHLTLVQHSMFERFTRESDSVFDALSVEPLESWEKNRGFFVLGVTDDNQRNFSISEEWNPLSFFDNLVV